MRPRGGARLREGHCPWPALRRTPGLKGDNRLPGQRRRRTHRPVTGIGRRGIAGRSLGGAVKDILRIDGLTAGYDGAAVVRDLDLTVDAGEVVALLGPNGAGKTTTLRAISGIVRPMGGRLTFDGADLTTVSPSERARRGIAHVPEDRGIFFGLTVAEHFRLCHRGERLDERTAYEYFPLLRELRTRRVGLLSGGEQQMLAVGRALARRPRLLLLDELTLGLAPVIVERLLPVVRRYALDSGCGVLLVEQQIQLALEVVDRGYVLSRGEIVLHRPIEELRADRRLLIASYLGETRTREAEDDAAASG
ncbi:MAG: ATP-binding cassette domain-containing protein [Streptosporangiales bacterium]|nr:ATP-binding cassette domain-containing protein [Streptosporangiales bacterium]